MNEPLIGAAENDSAKAHLLDDGDIEAMRIKAEAEAIVAENKKKAEAADE